MSDQTHAPQSSVEKMTASLKENREWLDSRLKAERSFDLIRREIRIGGRDACLYFIDGFCKDELMQKLLEHFMEIQETDLPADAGEMAEGFVPYVEVEVKADWEEILYSILSGVSALFVDGYGDCILIDSRTYPARSV